MTTMIKEKKEIN